MLSRVYLEDRWGVPDHPNTTRAKPRRGTAPLRRRWPLAPCRPRLPLFVAYTNVSKLRLTYFINLRDVTVQSTANLS